MPSTTVSNLDAMKQGINSAAQQVVKSGQASQSDVDAFVAKISADSGKHITPEVFLTTPLSTPPASGQKTLVQIPQASQLSTWEKYIILGGATACCPPFMIAYEAAVAAAAKYQITIGLGPQVTGGFNIGGSLGCGIVVDNQGNFGYYGEASGINGAIASISATMQLTMIKGDMSHFGGSAVAVTLAGGEAVVGDITLLAVPDPLSFLGVSVGMGLGAGIPCELYVSYSGTWENYF